MLDTIVNLQRQYESRSSVEQRKRKGQYFTPPEVGRFMASLFSEPKGDHYRFLDPGAGVGSLTAALCERLGRSKHPLHIEAVLFENDRSVLPYLRRAMEHCSTELQRSGHRLTVDLREHDFILDAAAFAQGNGGLFDETGSVGEVDGVIMNPPYFKLSKGSEYAKVMEAVVHGQPNIYAFFLAAAAQMLRPGGELAGITPRSFCNGLYFRGFRRWFLERMALDHIHLFESRSDTFRDVLQESVVTLSHRLGEPSARITVSTSYGRDLARGTQVRKLPAADIVDSATGDYVIRVPASDEDSAILEAVESWPGSVRSRRRTVAHARDSRCGSCCRIVL